MREVVRCENNRSMIKAMKWKMMLVREFEVVVREKYNVVMWKNERNQVYRRNCKKLWNK